MIFLAFLPTYLSLLNNHHGWSMAYSPWGGAKPIIYLRLNETYPPICFRKDQSIFS